MNSSYAKVLKSVHSYGTTHATILDFSVTWIARCSVLLTSKQETFVTLGQCNELSMEWT